jgi:hypothetical protein
MKIPGSECKVHYDATCFDCNNRRFGHLFAMWLPWILLTLIWPDGLPWLVRTILGF